MASSRSLGTLTLDLLIKTGSFVTGLDKAERTAKQKLSSMEKAAFSFGKTFGVAFAAAGTAALAGLSSLTKAAIDNADSLRDLSIRVGVSTETLSGYGYAASQTGTDIESLSTGLKILAKNAAAALDPTSQQAKIFDALGISVKDVQGNLRDLDELVPEIATKFKVLEDGTTKAALSQQLFGKSGLDLVEFFNLGGQGLADLTAKFRALGGEIDQKTADAADNFKDTLGDVKVITSALGLSIARELLPTLQEGADDLKRMAIQGDLAANAATVLGAAVRGVVGLLDAYNNAVNRVSIAMEFAAQTGGSFARVLGSIASGGGLAALPGAIGKITDSYKDAQAQLDSLSKSHEQFVVNFAGEGPDPAGLFRRSPEEVDALKQVNSLQEKLTKAMAGGEKASKSRKTAISEEEKEAKRLLQTYEQLTESYAEQIALFGKEGEAARVRYDIEFGALKGLNQAQKESLLLQAERLDTMRDEKEVAEELARIEERRQENVASVLEDLRFETDSLGKTVEQQEKMNLLRYAGVDANSAYGQSILDAADKYQELRKATEDQIYLMDSVRDSARGFFDDLYDGVGIVDALKNAFGNLADQIFKWATNATIEKFFGQMGSSNSGSGGGWLSALFGSSGSSQGSIIDLFGSDWGFAGGGTAEPWSINRVNEMGPELFTVRGRDYLATGKDAVTVTPNRMIGGSGGGVSVTNVNNFASPVSEKTRSQMSAKQAFDMRRASRLVGAVG